MTRGGMLHVESKIEDCAQQQTARASYNASVLSDYGLVLVAGLMAQRHFAFSQQLPSSESDAQARSRDDLAHLNSVIQFYRASTQPIQNASEPNDVIYRDQA